MQIREEEIIAMTNRRKKREEDYRRVKIKRRRNYRCEK